ncbi:MAG: mechanosensitive ion channel [Vicinamibacterales bacterium]|nr:mechanosensitive ion channel [Vicinamibacterales bacterium]HJO18247.1 mechanosensitive ion channel [Vicinamibacterales bacterium]|tara:strand:- start:22415 stop:23686 length:1272 start_codon:yes stop_codon:yes gene_type:complete
MLSFIHELLIPPGLGEQTTELLTISVDVVAVLTLAFIADVVAKRIIVRAVVTLAARTSAQWDDAVLQHRVVHRLAHFAPAIVIYHFSVPVLGGYETWSVAIQQGCLLYMLFVAVLVSDGVLNAAVDILSSSELSRSVPLTSIVQVVKLVIYCVAAIAALSLVLGKSPVLLLSGLGAMTAVLMLVFKDPILGFIGGIQLSANQMVAPGDWIEMPAYGADGDVLEVGLTSVKIRNFDNTITTIPTYGLISGSFKNWRGMSESGGRRIKRAIHVDMNSIHFCDDETLVRLAKIPHMAAYLERKQHELVRWKAEHDADANRPSNLRRLTNVGTFRAYIVAYLRNHSMIHQEMTFLVRHLAPSAQGLPIEIYVFSRDTDWVRYEDLQADIFDHILAMAPEFGLSVYQSPSGRDVQDTVQVMRGRGKPR